MKHLKTFESNNLLKFKIGDYAKYVLYNRRNYGVEEKKETLIGEIVDIEYDNITYSGKKTNYITLIPKFFYFDDDFTKMVDAYTFGYEGVPKLYNMNIIKPLNKNEKLFLFSKKYNI